MICNGMVLNMRRHKYKLPVFYKTIIIHLKGFPSTMSRMFRKENTRVSNPKFADLTSRTNSSISILLVRNHFFSIFPSSTTKFHRNNKKKEIEILQNKELYNTLKNIFVNLLSNTLGINHFRPVLSKTYSYTAKSILGRLPKQWSRKMLVEKSFGQYNQH